jgi:hypothetical protein
MPKANIEAPDWLRHTERILEELNDGSGQLPGGQQCERKKW